jgi:hypothetical protein
MADGSSPPKAVTCRKRGRVKALKVATVLQIKTFVAMAWVYCDRNRSLVRGGTPVAFSAGQVGPFVPYVQGSVHATMNGKLVDHGYLKPVDPANGVNPGPAGRGRLWYVCTQTAASLLCSVLSECHRVGLGAGDTDLGMEEIDRRVATMRVVFPKCDPSIPSDDWIPSEDPFIGDPDYIGVALIRGMAARSRGCPSQGLSYLHHHPYNMILLEGSVRWPASLVARVKASRKRVTPLVTVSPAHKRILTKRYPKPVAKRPLGAVKRPSGAVKRPSGAVKCLVGGRLVCTPRPRSDSGSVFSGYSSGSELPTFNAIHPEYAYGIRRGADDDDDDDDDDDEEDDNDDNDDDDDDDDDDYDPEYLYVPRRNTPIPVKYTGHHGPMKTPRCRKTLQGTPIGVPVRAPTVTTLEDPVFDATLKDHLERFRDDPEGLSHDRETCLSQMNGDCDICSREKRFSESIWAMHKSAMATTGSNLTLTDYLQKYTLWSQVRTDRLDKNRRVANARLQQDLFRMRESQTPV